MSSKIYVGGLPYATTDAQLQKIFSAYGEVSGARQSEIIRDLAEAPDPNECELQELAQELVKAARRAATQTTD